MKKTIFSFLLLGGACAVMAQQPSSTGNPNANKNNTLNPPGSTTNSPVNSNPSNVTNNNALNANSQTVNTNEANKVTNMNTTVNGSLNTNTVHDSNMNNIQSGTGVVTSNNNISTSVYMVSVPSSVQGNFQKAYPTAANVTWQQSGDWYRAKYVENGKIMQASYREDGKAMTSVSSPILRTYVPEEIISKAINMYGVNVYAIARSKGTEGADVYNVTVIENGVSKTEWMKEDGTTAASPYRSENSEAIASNSGLNKDMDDESLNTSNTMEEETSTATMSTELEISENVNPDNSSLTTDDTIYDSRNQDQQTEEENSANTEMINNSTDSRLRRDDGDLQSDNSDDTSEPYEY